uniref:CYP727A4 n=1 Tax=Arundo donax TaxID=35708 RepID=A0A0A9DJT2_ARUDO
MIHWTLHSSGGRRKLNFKTTICLCTSTYASCDLTAHGCSKTQMKTKI